MHRFAFVVVMLACAPAVASTPMMVGWATWLRAGPSERAKVIDELPSGWRVDVLECADGWCRVLSDQAPGYVPQALLAQEAPRALQSKAGADCVQGTHQTPERAIPLRICPAE